MVKRKYKIKYKILEHQDILKQLKKIDGQEVEIIYETEIYDGPLEGVCVWKSKNYYFCNNEEIQTNDQTRAYLLVNLTESQWINELAVQNAYKKYIESYPYVTEGITSYRKGAEWDKYFDVCEKYSDEIIDKSQVAGWFEK
jgi:hypothetical protein